ncbi:MAG: FecR family protein [Chloroflexi bacterium]|nr:FecR family protein [Chloroflexota bacterium]
MPISARLPYNLRYILPRIAGLLIILSLVFYPCGPVSPVMADGDGWYLDGAPVIKKGDMTDTAAYFGKKLSLSDGSATGSMSWKETSLYKCSGTYTGTVTWTPLPSFMQPGSKVNFTESAKTTAQNTCGDRSIGSWGTVNVGGINIVEAADTQAAPATGTYTVRTGSPGAKLVVNVHVQAANLGGDVTYNYTYKGPGTPAPTSTSSTTSPKAYDAPGPLVDNLPAPPGEEPLGFVNEFNGTVYVSAGPSDLPPSQQKWMIVKGRTALYDGWNIRTAPGAEALVLFSSGALLRTKEATWWEMKPFITAETGQREMYGRLFKGIYDFYMEKHKEDNKKFEVETDMAICGIRGTNFVVEVTDAQTLLKVIEGIVEFTSKKDGQSASVEAGQMMAAMDSGLGQKSTFNAVAEKAKWGPMPPADSTPAGTAQSGSTTQTKKPGITLPKCPITSALEVNPASPRLTIFRNFRDKVLANSEPGREFIGLYYGAGTWIVDNLLPYPITRALARNLIIEPASLALNASSFIWNN